MSDHTNHTTTSAHTGHHEIGPWQILVESNLLNTLILVLVIFYLANKYLPGIVNTRKNQISKELEKAKEAKEKAMEELEKIKEKAKNLSFEVAEIKNEASKTAEAIRKSIEDETGKEIEMLKLKVKKEIGSLEEEAIHNIQKSASEAAIKLAEETLMKVSKNETVQKKLVNDFLSGLDKPSKN